MAKHRESLVVNISLSGPEQRTTTILVEFHGEVLPHRPGGRRRQRQAGQKSCATGPAGPRPSGSAESMTHRWPEP